MESKAEQPVAETSNTDNKRKMTNNLILQKLKALNVSSNLGKKAKKEEMSEKEKENIKESIKDVVIQIFKSEEARKYCNDLGFKYYETSAKTGENVNDTIKSLVREVLKKKIRKNKKEVNVMEIPKPQDSKKEGNCCCIIL